jgi:hypothetical protein
MSKTVKPASPAAHQAMRFAAPALEGIRGQVAEIEDILSRFQGERMPPACEALFMGTAFPHIKACLDRAMGILRQARLDERPVAPPVPQRVPAGVSEAQAGGE